LGYVWEPRQEVLGAITDRQVAGLRLFLSVSALAAITFDPSGDNGFINLAPGALLAYTLYSASIYALARHFEVFPRKLNSVLVATDVSLFSIFIWLSSGSNSILFFFYFFAILVACSRLGASAGWIVVFAATIAFLSLALFISPHGVEWSRVFVRSVSLFALGYALTYWAEAEEKLRRKLNLLREVSLTSNPRFGVDRTASHVMKRVLEFFNADACVLLEYARETDEYSLRTATAKDPDSGAAVLDPPEKIRSMLQGVTNEGVTLYTSMGWRRAPIYFGGDPVRQGALRRLDPTQAKPLLEWLGASCFMAVPLRDHEWIRGHLFVGSAQCSELRMEDAKFLLHLADQVTPVLEHIRLVDRMASGAAEEERRRIARSVHDRIIQPYLGLHMGLNGLREIVRSALHSDGTNAASSHLAMSSLDDLVDMAREGVEELREYVYDLRKAGDKGDILLNSLLRYAAKFETVTGIRVSVVSRMDSGAINDRLAGEIFQMAAEALSNVQRHTTATSVHLTVEGSPSGGVVVRIANETSGESAPGEFTPRSISERAQSLGGYTQVTNSPRHTVVNIEIPL
jgi:signal transduction histidine kinase